MIKDNGDWTKKLIKNLKPSLKIHISRPITSPSDLALNYKNVILIGAGSGIAPFLSIMDHLIHLAKHV